MNELTEFEPQHAQVIAVRRSTAYDEIRDLLYEISPYSDLPTPEQLRAAKDELSSLLAPAPRGMLLAAVARLVASFPNWRPDPASIDLLTNDLGRFPGDVALVAVEEIRLKPADFPPPISRIIEHCQHIFDGRRGAPINTIERAQAELHRRLGQANELLARVDEFEAAIAKVIAGEAQHLPHFGEFVMFVADLRPHDWFMWPIQLRSREPWICEFARWLAIGYRLSVAVRLKPGAISTSQAETVFAERGDAAAARDALRLVESKTFVGGGQWLTEAALRPVLKKRLADLWAAGRRSRDELTPEEMLDDLLNDSASTSG